MKTQSGFAMLEVLVSFLVIMIGVLGLAGLQMLSITNTENARYQGSAAMLAANLAAQIQANVAYWGGATAPQRNITVSTTAAVAGTGAPASSTTDCSAVQCTSAQMAYYDLNQWGLLFPNALPGGNATVACTAGATNSAPVCTITLFWNEKNVALYNPTGTEAGNLASGTSTQHQFLTVVTAQ